MWEEEYNRAQEESELLVFFHGSAHSLGRHPENQEADVLTQVQAVCSQMPLEAAHWVCVKSGHKGSQHGIRNI